jgi:hypothetical protein
MVAHTIEVQGAATVPIHLVYNAHKILLGQLTAMPKSGLCSQYWLAFPIYTFFAYKKMVSLLTCPTREGFPSAFP